MLKEMAENFTRKLKNVLAPQPSKELEDFNSNVLRGKDSRIPVYGKTQQGDVDIQCYGTIKGEERERVLIPWGNFEKSYLIKRSLEDPNGSINVVFEGFFPRAD